ncbi:penicillin acylase family protein [Pseudacidovorax intermedius]|uniref:Acylase n=1 Tax=Pseudacidovorax intermedius TaxID=433924 RepID=A0A147GXP6_9BURK|nr:penicillin acylase family protein [Pseudacidovorax intermedius]KTT22157.1 acylase [Pseudacidovorax intermedius]
MRSSLGRHLRPLTLLALASLAACGGSGGGNVQFTPAPAPAPAPAPSPAPAPAAQQYQAEIRRTAMGVPHIKAADWGGVGYGYGYAQAQDALCTMADAFLTYRGERSRWLGADTLVATSGTIGRPKNIDSDFFHRQVMDDARIQAIMAAQPAKLLQMVEGFTAGYNRYVREVKAGGSAGRHVACRDQAWVTTVTTADLWRRMYQANFAAGYSNFLAAIANAQPPASAVVTSRARREATRQFAAIRPQQLQAPALEVGGEAGVGSNMYGFGGGATGGGPLLFGNPHWYWRGPDRFYQAQLTIPGELDVSGSSFLGIPVILIGFNSGVAWSHTVSTARRFGFFQLTLASDDPTAYMRDGQKIKMTPQRITVAVKDGAPVTRTLYRSEYGPLVNLGSLNPALGWSTTTAFAIRDINADNYRLFRTWMRWNTAKSLDELIAIQKEEQSIPWVNTVAVGRGRTQAWYGDIGAMPNVPPAQLSACATPVSAALAGALPRVPVLDGSRAACNWTVDAAAAQPGALPAASMPGLLRDDYVANMNDSYWLANPDAPLTGFPAIIGPAGTEAQTLRTRLGHLMARARLAGTDGYSGNRATPDIVQRMVLNSRVLSAELVKDQALALACTSPTTVSVTADAATGQSYSPARTVDIAAACDQLRNWDSTGNPDARGAHVWDEFWRRAERLGASALWAVPFDAAHPLTTPRDLQPSAAGALRQAMGAATLAIQASGFALNAPRGETLFATRGGTRIPLYGGCGNVGYFTIACSEQRIEQGGYSMDGDPNGNSYMQVVRFDDAGVQAHTFLTFSQSDDPASPHNADYTRRYSAKQWLRVPFTEAEIQADAQYSSTRIAE